MDTLYIPANIKTRYELFDGFGMEECFITGVVTAIAVIIAIAVYATTKDVSFPVISVLIAMAASVSVTAKDKLNLSVVDYAKHQLRFALGQKKYNYLYRWEWRC